MDFTKYCFYVGTARGNLLYLTDKPENIKFSKNEICSEVTAMSFGRSYDELVVGYENGEATIYDTLKNEYTKSFQNIEGDGAVTGVGCIKKCIVLGKRDGVININHGKKNDFFSINLDEKGTLDSVVVNEYRDNIIGTGGEFNNFKLWDIQTQQCIFRAKSLGHDMLQLPIPTSIRDIAFFSDEPGLSVCATKEGHVLLYDDRAQRKPVVQFLEKKASYTCISTAFRERMCLVGTTRGYMQLLDMKAGKCIKTFTTFTGAVTSIVCDPTESIVISTCLDRYLRVHNIDTKELLHKTYMKQNLTKVLVKPVVKDEPEEKNNKEDNKNIDKEYEELFNNMEEIKADAIGTKHKRKIDSLVEKPKKSKKKKIKPMYLKVK